MARKKNHREFDFALIIDGVTELTSKVEDSLYEAGCDDATFSIRYGRLYAEFSRKHSSLKDAILSAIRDIHRAKVGALVLRVDDCDLVTQSDIARRIGRSRQLVSQYIAGTRGPGNFPPPEGHLGDNAPLWAWCAVSDWLVQNDIIRKEESWNAAVVATINNFLERARQEVRNPKLVKEIGKAVRELI